MLYSFHYLLLGATFRNQPPRGCRPAGNDHRNSLSAPSTTPMMTLPTLPPMMSGAPRLSLPPPAGRCA